MNTIVVVGSGPSGVHFTLSALKKGYDVLMVDVGTQKSMQPNPEDSLNDLKGSLSDPVEFFLGKDFEAVLYPGSAGEYYGFPPNKRYVFSKPKQFQVEEQGFTSLSSFAQGGLAEAWTAGVYPFNNEELSDFPFSYKDIEPFYNEVASRIGISGMKDDLAGFLPVHDRLMDPLELDQHSQTLLSKYEREKDYLNRQLGCYAGRARLAVLSRDKQTRKACTYRGRCLWGCPVDAFYTPSLTLRQCQRYSNFRYIPNHYISHFRVDKQNQITHVIAESVDAKTSTEFEVGTLVLAAGTLSTSRIVLDSIRINTGATVKLTGLMDNQQILIPFINLSMIGKPYRTESYQYHQLSLGFRGERPKEYIHALITTLKTALIHPLIHKNPLDLKSSLFIFRNLHAALGLVNVNLHDSRRDDNFVTIEANEAASHSKLLVKYSPENGRKTKIHSVVKRVRKALWRLGCIVPPRMVHVRPMGASVHYAGTIPMSAERKPLTVSPECQSHDFENLYIVDGTTFPFLPAKNITFTLMANAVRVAETAF